MAHLHTDEVTEALAPRSLSRKLRFTFLFAIVALSCFRLAHINLLWADEDYHLAAALQILAGKIPYRDFWYDKPPLSALFYLLIGAHSGWLLRLLDSAYILACCVVIYRLARLWWSEWEGAIAALLLAFFTTFYLPSAVIPFAADAVLLLPHLAAIYCTALRKPLAAGIFCGVAFLANAKAIFVLATCVLWLPTGWLALGLGFTVSAGAGCLALAAGGAWPGYVEQVWRWGFRYAAGSPVLHPFSNGLLRTLNWCGFHAALMAGSVVAFCVEAGEKRKRLLLWIFFSFCAVALGSRFAPHYFLQLLPPLVVAASRGLVWSFRFRPRLAFAVVAVTLLIPLVRFGPRYLTLTANNLSGAAPNWIDVAMDLDSQQVASFVNTRKAANDSLFVWGYRPDIYVYARLVADGKFWDSQPLTGVAADRHLHATTAIYSGPAQANRAALARTKPVWFVDGLGLLNPKLAPDVYPDLRHWLSDYKLVGRTKLSLIYHRRR